MTSDLVSSSALDWLGVATLAFLVVPALVGLLIGYLVIRMAVKHGILAADRARARDRWAASGWDRERL